MDAAGFLQHLQRVKQHVWTELGPLLRARGLAAGTLLMLEAVERHPHPTELSREIGMPAPTVSRLLKSLEADGYVVRGTDSADLRRYRFALTPAGLALRAEVRNWTEAAVERMLERLTPGERGDLERLLLQVAERRGG
jgi:DNA-binding MarR family transcriptional regulator